MKDLMTLMIIINIQLSNNCSFDWMWNSCFKLCRLCAL